MNIAILDDLKSDGTALGEIVSDYFKSNDIDGNIYFYKSAAELLGDFHNHSFSLVFLDIMMDGMTGMDAARAIRKSDERLPIVFVTVEKEFALDGYEVQAADFIIKPFDSQRIFRTLGRVFKDYFRPHYISIKENRIVKRILLDDILFAETRNHYVEIHTINNIYRSYMTFDEFYALLPQQDSFQICHRGIVVNFDRVLKLEEQSFLFENGETVPISRSKKAEIKNAYAIYAFERTRGSYE